MDNLFISFNTCFFLFLYFIIIDPLHQDANSTTGNGEEDDNERDDDNDDENNDDEDSNFYFTDDILLTEMRVNNERVVHSLPDVDISQKKFYLNKSAQRSRKFEKTVVCTCGRRFSYENLYVYHKRWECGQELTCRHCQRSYCSVYYVKRHMKKCKKRELTK